MYLKIVDNKGNQLSRKEFCKAFENVLERPLKGEILIREHDGKKEEYIVSKIIREDTTFNDENNRQIVGHLFTYTLSPYIGEL